MEILRSRHLNRAPMGRKRKGRKKGGGGEDPSYRRVNTAAARWEWVGSYKTQRKKNAEGGEFNYDIFDIL
jgi:hypothetical protein